MRASAGATETEKTSSGTLNSPFAAVRCVWAALNFEPVFDSISARAPIRSRKEGKFWIAYRRDNLRASSRHAMYMENKSFIVFPRFQSSLQPAGRGVFAETSLMAAMQRRM